MLTGPRGGRARCVDGGVSVVCVRCHGVSPFWARIRWAGPRVRVYAHTDPVPGAPQAVCSQGASAAHLLLVLPGPRPRRVLPASTPGQGCGFGVWRLGSDGARSADGCGESRCAQGVGSSRNGVSSGLRVSPSTRLSSVSHGCSRAGLPVSLDICLRSLLGVPGQGCLSPWISVSTLTGVRGQGCASPSMSVVGVSRMSVCRRCLMGVRLSSVSQGCPSVVGVSRVSEYRAVLLP